MNEHHASLAVYMVCLLACASPCCCCLGLAGHFLGEDMPSLYNTLCKDLGRCAPGNTSGLHLVLRRQRMFSWPGYVDAAMACLAESRLVRRGLAASNIKSSCHLAPRAVTKLRNPRFAVCQGPHALSAT